MDKNFRDFACSVQKKIPHQFVLLDPLSRYAYANDASHYYLVPKIIILVENEEQVKWVFYCANLNHISVTIRAAGSSLSGQSITDSCLLVINWNWRKILVENQGFNIKLSPGIIASEANYALKMFQRKIGPDPASSDFAKIGGIIANNASGMCCGTQQNSYKTLKDIRCVLSNGSIFDTSSPFFRSEFKKQNPELITKIVSLHEKIISSEEIKNKIQQKYSIKNTVGYSVNAFLDFQDPIDIISHLFVGSEGTLGFISEVDLYTVEDPPIKSVSLLLFSCPKNALEFVNQFDLKTISSLEFLDYRSLQCVWSKITPFIQIDYPQNKDEFCILIIEIRDYHLQEIENKITSLNKIIKKIDTVIYQSSFYFEKEYAEIMGIRKSILPIIQSRRNQNSICLLEDIAFPLNYLSEGITCLYSLFKKYSLQNSCIFGHAKDGNLHFLLELNFNKQSDIEKYQFFMEELAVIVLKYNGSLKAEHGTGRNIAPFVESEWGKEITLIMHEIKNIFDPNHLLNPNVIISADKKIHIKNLKSILNINSLLDKCNECGRCEQVCPSTGYTFTPRQRITALRAIEHVKKEQNIRLAKEMLKEFKIKGSDSCAASSMCAIVCPVKVDTGQVIKEWRKIHRNKFFSPFVILISKIHFMLPFLGRIFLYFKGIK
ncbi:FAD-binding and (Fe-S)-binding domain-containing protein [Pigmentibacter sp. JX0631]|uniref:FAD-binding and (Fe-S)-binding domain-containing protein n=1 Tax=Pigmentibacter sp. JX0631 TaxID=2976982 RepID=UPI0024683CA3|nr:FAD-binding and (Fe-S)-binding domain-containing protein [Pigmentibacter sp. JX0631]WGL60777.1 FAD-binding and (Fe-S)-binding domain-containing protein [Pigmentibacter sp. JX0631]